ncbi:antiviral innate immune response receptor RIG-I isoform X1 [Octopus vulgaris]|uniref:RNA helicase n=1 Tax=Octopus vulgaris TaxID=6645 RepID=A0AA36ALF7_OCTVU|nr:antiviral innate immune response receptor RIG-I isoform X1 [Octopus vulgaris]
MAERFEKLFNSINPLCVGYIEATHLLPYMPFMRSKAGSIFKAHKKSSEEGFQVMYDALIQSDTENKWDIYNEALKEAEFNSICKLYAFMQEQTNDFNSYCNIFEIFSTEITEGQLNIIRFANHLKTMETILESQLEDIKLTEKKEGPNSAAILLFAYFPSTLSYLMKDLDKYLNIPGKDDLWKKIQNAVPVCEDEVNCVSNNRAEMIMQLRQVILETVHPRDIWLLLSLDLNLPSNNIEFNRIDIGKVMHMYEHSSYQGKSQTLYQALSDAGYEQLCLKIDGRKCHDEVNNVYKQLIVAHHKMLTEKIKTLEILDKLLAAKVINKRDKDDVDAKRENKGDITAAQCLLEIIPSKKDMWHKDFFEILCKNKQRDLVKELEPDYNCNSDTEADIDSDTNLDTNHEDNPSQIQKQVGTNAKEIVLREYQKELISKALLGKNCIITAPTGSGKTFMAVKIIEDHFQKNEGKVCKVIFLCNQTNLAEQQKNVLIGAFPDLIINVIYGSPESQSKKMESFTLSNIVVMTPQCLVDNLKHGRIESLSIITLLIIDECHHTYSKHPYNILMSRYLDEKFEKANCQLPQVIGLTAVAGIDVTKTGKNAKEHILEICANLDCDELCITRDNIKELCDHVPVPVEDVKSLPMERESALSKVIKSFMSDVHSSLNNRELSANSLQFGTTQYIGWLSDAKKKVNSSPFELKHEFASIQYLEKCNIVLRILNGYRAKDALEILYDYIENETLETDAFQNLKILLKRKLEEFEGHSTQEELEAESSCLLELVDLIQKKFHDKPDSRVIVFAETKILTRILAKVLKDKSETADFNPQYLMAGLNKDSGPGMSLNKQKDTLGMFRSGMCKLLVSTPVAEEGLDIQKCNLVVDYLTVQGVRSHVQKRGRARASDGEFIQIIGSDPLLDKRATVNRIKVNQMQIIVNEVYEDQLNDPDAFKKTLKEIQMKNKQERDAAQVQKMKLVKASGTYELKCTSCNCTAAESSDFRNFEEKCYVIVNLDFRKKISISRSRPSILFDDVKRIGSIFCDNCGLYWGNQLVYKHTIFDCISIKQFKIVPEGKDPILAKKWLKVPFRDAVQPLTEEDFKRVREDSSNKFEDDLLPPLEKFPTPESNSNID